MYLSIYVEFISRSVIVGPQGIFYMLSFNADFQFSKVFALIYTPTSSIWEFQLLSTSAQHFSLCIFFTVAILMGA